MRGLTDQEAKYMRGCFHIDPDQEISPPDEWAMGKRLVARGLLREVDDAHEEWSFHVITPLGRIALACHAAVSVTVTP